MSRSERPLSQQFPPPDPILKDDEPIAREELVRKSTRHEPLPEKRLPCQPGSSAPTDPDDHRAMERRDDPERNGDLPVDQLIPLDELPRDARLSSQTPGVAFDDQPLLRRPKRRPASADAGSGYDAEASFCVGIALIVIGICEIVLNIIALVLQQVEYPDSVTNIAVYLAPGIWCAVFFILSGTFGVLSARWQQVWTVVTYLVTSTLAAVFAGILLAFCGWGIFNESSVVHDDDGAYDLPSLIIFGLMLLGALLALILNIVASALCCRFFCHRPFTKSNYGNTGVY